MTTKQLFAQFSYGINWNALFYFSYKILVTSFSFFLYYHLTTNDFALWANINSALFLLLLWIDFGLRKSIPRYAPEFAKNKNAAHLFIKYIIMFHIIILCLALPIFLYYTYNLLLFIDNSTSYIWCFAGALFIVEGIIGLMRLVFHSYFWNKQFNVLMTIIISIEITTNVLLILRSHNSRNALYIIFTTKILIGIAAIILSIRMLKRLYKDESYPGTQHINIKTTTKGFIKHSAIMWGNNSLKSLSERNFLVPFFTYTLGAGAANLFKVANDAALLFYRLVIKTIGTADTSLLAHIEASGQNKRLMQIIFKKLTAKVAALCLPLLGIIGFIFLQGNGLLYNTFVFQAFMLMVVGYLVEVMFLSYERILEIKKIYSINAFLYSLYNYYLFPYIRIRGSVLRFIVYDRAHTWRAIG